MKNVCACIELESEEVISEHTMKRTENKLTSSMWLLDTTEFGSVRDHGVVNLFLPNSKQKSPMFITVGVLTHFMCTKFKCVVPAKQNTSSDAPMNT